MPSLEQTLLRKQQRVFASRGGKATIAGLALTAGAFYTLGESGKTVRADDGQTASVDLKIRSAPTSELLRTLAVYSVCQVPWIVDNSPTILATMGSIPVFSSITQFFVRHTFFAQFVGGETPTDCLSTIRSLRKNDIGTLLNYSVEVPHDDSESDHSIAADAGIDLNADIAERRKKADKHVEETIESIEVAGEESRTIKAPGQIGSTWVAIKLTGLMTDPSVLHRTSNTILALRAAQKLACSETYYPGTPADKELSLMTTFPAPSYPLPSIPDGVSADDLDQLRTLYSDMRRILSSARQNGVRVLIDAEHTWYQPAIDAFQTILSAEFNRLPGTAVKETPAVVDVPVVQPLVYGTYQAYLRRNPEHLKHSLAHARAHGYALGVKLVRGAYHEQESARWRTMGCDGPTPVWATKPETDACYDGALELALDLVKDDIERNAAVSTFAVLFGTHNKDSVALVASGLQKRGLAIPTSEGSLLVGNEARKRVAVAQLYGMCDALTNATAQAYVPGGSPIVLKYVPWGQLDDVMPYLGRRAIENKTVLKGEGGATSECARAWNELKRRWFGFA